MPAISSYPSIFRGMDSTGLVTLPKGKSQAAHDVGKILFPPSNVSLKDMQSSSPDETVLSRAKYLNGMASVGCDGMSVYLCCAHLCWPCSDLVTLTLCRSVFIIVRCYNGAPSRQCS